MIPYFEQPFLEVGPLTFRAFGTCVAIAVLLGLSIAQKRAEEYGIPRDEITSATWGAVIVGLLGSAFFQKLFYEPESFKRGIISAFNPAEGMSSFGGFISAIVFTVIYCRIKGRNLLRFGDVLIQAIALIWPIARLGCALAHDHKGRLTDFFLGFDYPGGARHNLGFYESLYCGIVIVPAFLVMHRKDPWPTGTYVAAICILYAPVRFFFDFLRATDLPLSDTRYAGLTFAQYASLAMLGAGIWLARRLRTEAKIEAAGRHDLAGRA